MSADDLQAALDAFASSAVPPRSAPAPPASLSAVDLAVRGERIVRLGIGHTPAERVPGSGPTGSRRATIMDATLRYVQEHFPGTGCSFKGGQSGTDCEIVLSFSNTPQGLRGFDWFQGQGRHCRMPIPDSDIAVHIPMKAFVSRPSAPQVTLMIHDVPSDLWKSDLAALFLRHFGVQCAVKAEYAPAVSLNGTTYHGLLRRGCIKAELDPAPTCDFSELPKTVMFFFFFVFFLRNTYI
jgi:hypothetical protein